MASQLVPVALTRTGPPSGPAITVVDPFSSTVTPSSAAACRACASRRASTAARSVPSSRASSPACGVISVGASRRSSARWRAAIVRPSASTSTGRSPASTLASSVAASSSGAHARTGHPGLDLPGRCHGLGRGHRPGRGQPARRVASRPTTVITASGQCCRAISAACAADTSRIMPAPPRKRAAHGQRRRTGEPGAARDHAEHPAPVLVRLGARPRQQRRHVGRLQGA